jgi:hypothetical protein
MLDDGQPQSGAADLAAAAGIDPVKPFKDPGQVFRGNTGSAVPHPDEDLGSRALGLHLNSAARLAEFNGIVHQIHQGLFQEGWIDLSPEIFGAMELNGNIPGLGLGLADLDGAFQDPLDFLALPKYLPAFGILFDADRVSRSSMISFRRSVCLAMICKKFVAFFGSLSAPASKVSTKPLMEVMGVFSSWETLATKSRRVFSS